MKRITALLMILALLLALGACGGSGTPAGSTAASEAGSVPETAAEPAPEAEGAGEATVDVTEAPLPEEEAAASVELPEEEPAPAFVDVDLPLVDEPTEMSFWLALKPFLMAYNLDVNELTFFREMEARTGVSLDISSVAIFAANEAFNLIIASGDYPDMMDSFQVMYTGSADSAIDQEIIVDLMDYIDLMPNYQAALDTDHTFWMDSLTPGGALPSANMLWATSEGATIGFMIREDWLQECGLEVPVTYDDMEKTLEAFKQNYGVAALGISGYGQGWGVAAGMGVRDLDVSDASKSAFLVKDGQVSYSPATEEYRDYLELIHDWYEKGYVWQDFVSSANSMYQYMLSGEIGVCTQERDLIQMLTDMMQAEDPDAGWIGIRGLRKNPGDELHISYFVEKIIYGIAVAATSEHKELAAQWLDYCYSPDGQLLTNYGVEGEGLQFDAEGNPSYTDLVLHSETYSTVAASAIYSQYGGAMLCQGDRTFAGYTDRTRNAIELWAQDGQDWMYPTKATMTTEQGEEYTTLINEINGYIAEMTLKFIIGEVELNDDTWATYMTNVENMGLARAVEIKQEALDAYLANE